MSLRTKLYFGFFGMVTLAALIGIIAIMVFSWSASSLHESDQKTAMLAGQLMPSSRISSALSDNNIKAGFRFYGYSLGANDEDFRFGDGFIRDIRGSLDELEKLLNTPGVDLPFTRGKRPDIVTALNDFDKIRNELKKVVDERRANNLIVSRHGDTLRDIIAEVVDAMKKNIDAGIETLANNGSDENKVTVHRRAGFLISLIEVDEETNTARILRLRAFNPLEEEDADKLLETALDHMTKAEKSVNDAISRATTPNTKAQFTSLLEPIRAFQTAVKEERRLNAESKDAVDRMMASYRTLDTLTTELATKQASVTAENVQEIETNSKSITGMVSKWLWAIIIIVLATVVTGMALAIFITRGIVNPVNRIIGELDSGAEQMTARR